MVGVIGVQDRLNGYNIVLDANAVSCYNVLTMEQTMKATLRKMGNSQGVLIPKAVVEQLGIKDVLDLTVADGALVLRVPAPVGVDQDKRDAERFRLLMSLMQQAYDGEPIELDGLTAYCGMESGWKGRRNVKAELRWEDARDEPLGLAGVLDMLLARGQA